MTIKQIEIADRAAPEILAARKEVRKKIEDVETKIAQAKKAKDAAKVAALTKKLAKLKVQLKELTVPGWKGKPRDGFSYDGFYV